MVEECWVAHNPKARMFGKWDSPSCRSKLQPEDGPCLRLSSELSLSMSGRRPHPDQNHSRSKEAEQTLQPHEGLGGLHPP